MPITRSQSRDWDKPFFSTPALAKVLLAKYTRAILTLRTWLCCTIKDTTASAVGHRRSTDEAGDRHG
jgi:hypothetical protein